MRARGSETMVTARIRAIAAVAAFAVAAALVTVVGTAPATGHGGLPAGFEDTAIVSVTQPTDLAWTPDGRMIVTSKLGEVRIVDAAGNLVATPAIDLGPSLCTNVERGLGGVTVHPDFGVSNNWIYLWFTFNKYGTCNEFTPDSPVNRLARFELPPSNVIDPASELVMFDTPYLRRWHHNAGDMEFGPDGYLYVTIGDGGHKNEADEVDFMVGKIIRLTDDGDIPPGGNAFNGPNSVRCNVDGVPPAGSPANAECQEIYTLGHRNPFRFAMDPNSPTTRFFVLDVGQDVWESIDEVTVPGLDYGWPSREGPCAFGSNTNCAPVAGKTDPIHWYEHPGGGGAAITGGAFVPDGVWPAEYDGAFLYADYVLGHIYKMDPGGADCRLCIPPTSAFQHNEWAEADTVVEMAFGPHGSTQSLYYLDRGANEVRRIAYVGSANRTPIPVAATTTPPYGSLPLNVSFDGTGSFDPDLDPLTYEWDFKDGSPVDTSATPTHQFTVGGVYDVELTVDDGNGGTASTTIRVDAGNLPPAPTIISPAPADEFTVGQAITLTGAATDPEDGTLTDLDLSWEVRQHHNVHFHPFLAAVGNNLVINGPEPEDLPSTTNSNLEVRLTATDSWGLSATVSEFVDPVIVNATFETGPPGLDLIVAGETVTGPSTLPMWEDWTLPVSAPDQVEGGLPYIFTNWNIGGAQAQDITIGATPTTYRANFQQTTRIVPGAASVAEGDSGTVTIDVPVTLSAASNQTVTAQWQTFDSAAVSPDDFVANSGSVTFVPGDTEETVSITVNGDDIFEGDELFFVSFHTPTNAVIGGFGGLAFATITDDDPEPIVSPGLVTLFEGDTGTTTAQLPVTLSNPSATAVTVDYVSISSAGAGIATPDVDFTALPSTTLTFLPGETAKTIAVDVIGDLDDEPPAWLGEWGLVSFSNPSGGTVDTIFFGLGLVIIIDDD